MAGLPLTRVPGTVKDTVSWERVPGAIGYRFTVRGKLSHTWDGARTSVKVEKDQPIIVESLLVGVMGQDPSATPPPPPSGIEAPRPPIVTIKDTQGVGVNVTSREDLTDIIIDGTGDTGVLFQKNAGGSTLRRVVMRNVAATNQVSWGKHAIYGKAPDLTLENIDAQCSRYCASGFSLRFNGATVRDSKVTGAGFAITYFETTNVKGKVIVENVEGDFRNDTAIWMDAETDYQSAIYQGFEFRGVNFWGPSDFFLKISQGRMQGSVLIDGCTVNGKPVTKSMVSGVSNLTIT